VPIIPCVDVEQSLIFTAFIDGNVGQAREYFGKPEAALLVVTQQIGKGRVVN